MTKEEFDNMKHGDYCRHKISGNYYQKDKGFDNNLFYIKGYYGTWDYALFLITMKKPNYLGE